MSENKIGRAQIKSILRNIEAFRSVPEEQLEWLISRSEIRTLFIGARPYTEWLSGDVIKNERGFIETGQELNTYGAYHKIWKLERKPLPMETSVEGIFAAGDVRAGAMNRVASAVGEGSMAIKLVHEYMALV